MLAIELVRDPEKKTPAVDETLRVTQEALQCGVIAIRAGLYSNCIRFLPPLNISDADIDEGMSIL